MPISCHMRDLGFSDSEAPASKGPAPKPTHIEHFFFIGSASERARARRRERDRRCEAEGAGRLLTAAGAERSRAPVGAGRRLIYILLYRSLYPSPCRGGATSRASGGRGGWCGTASLRSGLASRRAFEKVARLTSSWRNWPAAGVLARCRAPRGRRHLSWLAPRGRRHLRLTASRGQRHLRCRVPHGRPRTPPS